MHSQPSFSKIFAASFFFISLICSSGFAQDYGNWQAGVYIMTGQSLGIVPSGSTLNNQITDQRQGFVSTGLYGFIRLKKDSVAYNSSGLFRFMRIDLSLTNRAGIFELDNGTYAKINTAGYDVTVLFPLSFKAAKEIDAYVAIGPFASYRNNRKITPTQGLPPANNLESGLALEMGFRLKSGSAIGYRVMNDMRQGFTYRVGGVFFAFSPQNMPKRKTIGRKV